MVSVEVANEWYLVVWEGLGGREGEQARRLPVWELGWCRVLGGRLREPRMSELGAGGRVSVGLPNEWYLLVVGESVRGWGGAGAEGCLVRSSGGVGCWARGLESRG